MMIVWNDYFSVCECVCVIELSLHRVQALAAVSKHSYNIRLKIFRGGGVGLLDDLISSPKSEESIRCACPLFRLWLCVGYERVLQKRDAIRPRMRTQFALARLRSLALHMVVMLLNRAVAIALRNKLVLVPSESLSP